MQSSSEYTRVSSLNQLCINSVSVRVDAEKLLEIGVPCTVYKEVTEEKKVCEIISEFREFAHHFAHHFGDRCEKCNCSGKWWTNMK